jgi:SAM-dependent methyltransferase
MTYAIEETNLERQALLAEWLDPLSLDALKSISLARNAKVLDVGCGAGNTTLMLNSRFPGATLTGLDGDESLIREARYQKSALYPNLEFLPGDVQRLPFPDNHFDLVFNRYVLQFIPDPLSALTEMKRVCKPGGIVFSQEPDANSLQSYPENWGYPRFLQLASRLFIDALIGRKMPHYFNKLGMQDIQHNAQVVLADHHSSLKRFFSLTAVAIRDGLLENRLLSAAEFEDLIAEMVRTEQDPGTVLLSFPTITVWGIKPLQ